MVDLTIKDIVSYLGAMLCLSFHKDSEGYRAITMFYPVDYIIIALKYKYSDINTSDLFIYSVNYKQSKTFTNAKLIKFDEFNVILFDVLDSNSEYSYTEILIVEN